MSPAYRGTISMVPQFQKDGVSLYRGDALAVLSVLSDNSVDAILTDPPYSSGGVTLGARQAEPSHKYQSSETKRQYPPMLGDAKDQRSWTMWCTLSGLGNAGASPATVRRSWCSRTGGSFRH